MSDMQGGTFSITNGGSYGSLLSTPIINPPQSGILGMHNIVDRGLLQCCRRSCYTSDDVYSLFLMIIGL